MVFARQSLYVHVVVAVPVGSNEVLDGIAVELGVAEDVLVVFVADYGVGVEEPKGAAQRASGAVVADGGRVVDALLKGSPHLGGDGAEAIAERRSLTGAHPLDGVNAVVARRHEASETASVVALAPNVIGRGNSGQRSKEDGVEAHVGWCLGVWWNRRSGVSVAESGTRV